MSPVPYPKENNVKMVIYNLPRYTCRHRHNFDQNSLYNEWNLLKLNTENSKPSTMHRQSENRLFQINEKMCNMSCCWLKYFLHISNRIQCIVFVGTGSKLEPGFFNNYLRELSAFERFIFFSSTYFFNEENMKSTVTIYIYYLPYMMN